MSFSASLSQETYFKISYILISYMTSHGAIFQPKSEYWLMGNGDLHEFYALTSVLMMR